MKLFLVGLLTALVGARVSAEEPPPPPPLTVTRAPGPITVDGDLSDPGWVGAASIETFYETVFSDNRPPTVKTSAMVTYDEKYFYIGIRCDDPDPSRIRAPFADRDNVIGTDDNIAVFLDTRGDRRSAQEFRVSPRGIQADGVFNDANANEDFSPDFYYDTAARITDTGWQAEIRIPFSSLRYPHTGPHKWGLIIWRNYPREFRYAIYSSPLPRGSNCLICHAIALEGLTDLPSSGHLVVAPYVSAQEVARAPALGAPLAGGTTDARAGLDVKWTPTADTALDATLNPDFSQVEADVAQIAVNNRFALFFPEKRPFFLEGVDLFDTPIQAVYTRTITSPRWGLRTTGKLGASSYTVLLGEDKGGGSVILPGPTSSSLAPQDFSSVVGIARWRRDLGQSFMGLLYTGREIEGGGHNRVLGPDFQWRPNETDRLTGQLLLSDTQTPRRPDLAPEWDGRTLTSQALSLAWARTTRTIGWTLRYKDFGDGFRADDGFIPQVGYRDEYAVLGYTLFPHGFFNFVNPLLSFESTQNRGGDLINRHVYPGIFVAGRHNLQAEFDLFLDRVLTGTKLLPRTQLNYTVQVDPSRRFSRIGLNGFVGEDIDIANIRVGHGASVTGYATVRPTDHLALDANSAVSWLNVDTNSGARSRLFTAQVQRLKATYNFSPRAFLRLIGQYVSTRRDPTLYTVSVPARDGGFSGSALFSFRLNWQTALFLGYGDDRSLTEVGALVRSDRQFFLKLSYAFHS
jgi:hypothetical protein